MWVLLWLQLLNGNLDHYHIGSYSTEEQCKANYSKAKVLVKNNNSKIVCIKIER